MPGEFDVYHKWLGIPPHEQPPTHYRLLGLAAFESDPDVIGHAADARMAHLKRLPGGPPLGLVAASAERSRRGKDLSLESRAQSRLRRPPSRATRAATSSPGTGCRTAVSRGGRPLDADGRCCRDPHPSAARPATAPCKMVQACSGNRCAGLSGRGHLRGAALACAACATAAARRDEPALRYPAAGRASATRSCAFRCRRRATAGSAPGSGSARDGRAQSDRSQRPSHVRRQPRRDAGRSAGNRADAGPARDAHPLLGERRRGAGEASPGDRLDFGDASQTVVSAKAGEVVLRAANGAEHRYTPADMPPAVAVALADRVLPTGQATRHLCLGAFWAIDAQGDQVRVREHWILAGRQGESLLESLG